LRLPRTSRTLSEPLRREQWPQTQAQGGSMKTISCVLAVLIVVTCATSDSQAQQTQRDGGIPVQLLVTVEPKHGSSVPEIKREDVMVFEGRERLQVIDWVPAT